ncbi:lysylphosphatidylglycerol synthase transmembrane domain-containing protein [Acanthopleuribacter pedis]|uniref:Flippase-like domain-containing protein n=1 Tax=Acanthopleuribacter pedis TaxID=442870 RepID=A0A8J7U4H9_9BACT|nr:lysylphosphatidylglycerol synthase transmembrane domain-containing protein [Acanthopleuribacter pedis]MBO1321498.1 flippase-like domain-containing protein [Acanthopleuribacter pedis]
MSSVPPQATRSLKPGKLLQWLVALGCLAYVGHSIYALGPEKVWNTARSADAFWLALSFAPLPARFLIWAVKWGAMLRRETAIPLKEVGLLVLVNNFLNLVTPSAKLAGGFFRGFYLAKTQGWTMRHAYGWTLADQISMTFGNIFLFSVLGLWTGFFLETELLNGALPYLGAVGLILLTAIFFLRPALWRIISNATFQQKIDRWLPKRFLFDEAGEKRLWLGPLLKPTLCSGSAGQWLTIELFLSACSFVMLCLANALVLRSLGTDSSIVLIAVILMLATFAGTILGVMGGIGVTEVFLMTLYPYAGIPPEAAAAGALLHRASFYAVTLVLGGAAFWTQGKHLKACMAASKGEAAA